MRYACREVEGRPEQPVLHIPMWPLDQSEYSVWSRKVVCLFKQETPEEVRWPLWKRGQNPMTRQKYSQIASQLHI